MNSSSLLKKIFLLTALLGTTNVFAEPWIGTENLNLRSDIQLLADLQLLSTPTTSYPLMWNSIVGDLKTIETSQLSPIALKAFLNVQAEAKKILRTQTQLNLNASSQNNRFTSYGETNRDKTSLNLSHSLVGDSWAGKLAYHYVNNPIDGKQSRFDDSYLAKNWGNWVITVGQQNRWWGPGWDTNLSLTNNARPIPSISLSRNTAEPFSLPFFEEVKIPWTVSTFMGKMEKERIVPNTLLWGFRLTARPIPQLEIGLTRLAQWGGDGRPKNASTFSDVLFGNDLCGVDELDCSDNQEPGNQMAGWDFRWSSTIAEQPYAIYGQVFAEDGSSETLSFLTEKRYQIGFDTQLNLFNHNWRIFVEATDTYADCSDTNNIDDGNCYYEHHIYQTGMRFQQRTIANLYDNDARSYVLGFISQTSKNSKWQFKIRKLELNYDNADKVPNNPLIGNTLTEIAENMLILSTQYQWQSPQWGYTLGGQLSRSSFREKESSTDINLQSQISYYF